MLELKKHCIFLLLLKQKIFVSANIVGDRNPLPSSLSKCAPLEIFCKSMHNKGAKNCKNIAKAKRKILKSLQTSKIFKISTNQIRLDFEVQMQSRDATQKAPAHSTVEKYVSLYHSSTHPPTHPPIRPTVH